MTKTKLPVWFKGEVYDKGEKIMNRFTGEEAECTAEETSMYDFIMGCEMVIEMHGGFASEKALHHIKEMRKGLDWFRRSNPSAYMTLLD